MRESGFDRTFRYFALMAEQYVLYAVGLGAAMVVYMWLINGSVSFMDRLPSMPATVLYISAFMLFVVGMTAGQQWYSMLIAMGCRRRNVFLGDLTMNSIYIAECLILYEVLERVINPGNKPLGIVIILTVFLILEAVSKLIGIATIKWGKIANVFVVIVIFALSLTFGIWIGYSEGTQEWGWVHDIVSGRLSLLLQCLLTAIGMLAFALSYLCMWQFLKNYEVRT